MHAETQMQQQQQQRQQQQHWLTMARTAGHPACC
jgi:hypothetical protein